MDKRLKYLLLMLLLILGCVGKPKDCAGVAGGTAELDNCNVCDTDKTNDCIFDCAGVWGGGAVLLWGKCYPVNTTSLDLRFRFLTGSIPSAIGNLTNLTALNLYNNQLIGDIPVEIANLTNLTYLNLKGNKLTGEIPQTVCDLIESNGLNIDDILTGNNLINTCE